MNAFSYSTYKGFLKAFIADSGVRGIVSQIANVCGCDRTYISQVLNGKAELTPDHMIQFCEGFGFNDQDSEYLLLLLLRDRSASGKSRKLLDTKLKKMKSDSLEISKQVLKKEKTSQITESQRTLYYSNWAYGAIHILTSIPEFQTQNAIAQKLHLPPLTIGQMLKELVDMGVVKNERGKFVHSGGDIYLPRDNPQSAAHHLSWRMKAVERSFEKDDVHYTLSFSVSENDVEKLKIQILDLIEEQRLLVRSSGTDVACAFCIDFFTL